MKLHRFRTTTMTRSLATPLRRLLPAICASCLAVGTAHAQSGDVDDGVSIFHPADATIVQVGVVHLQLHSNTTGLVGIGVPPGADLRVGNATTPFFSIERLITSHVGIELLAGIPPRQDVYGAGSIAFQGKVASVKQNAPTLMLNYHFLQPGDMVRPFVGIGVNHTHFYGAESSVGQTISLTNSNGLALQGGASVRIADHWSAYATVLLVNVHSDLLAVGVNPQTTRVNFRPTVYGAGVSYAF